MKQWIQHHRPSVPLVCCGLLFAAQLLSLLVINLTRSEELLDYDSALTFRHALEMWKNGTIFLSDVYTTSSLELDCTAFWAVPLWLLTGNLSLSYSIVHTLVLGLTLLLCRLILRRQEVKPVFRLVFYILLLTPYTVGQLEYMNMLFCSAGQYAFRLLVLLFLLYFTDCDPKKAPKRQWIPLLILYYVFFALTTLSCGTYVPLMLLGPFVLMRGIVWIQNRKEKPWIFQLLFLGGSFLVSLGCLMLRHGHVTGSGTVLCSSAQLMTNLKNCLTGIFILLGAVPQGADVAVFSLTGVVCVAKYIGLFFALWVVVHCLRRGIIAPASDFACSILCFVFCHLFVLVITETRYGSDVFESRYHLFWWIAFLLLLVVCLQAFWEKLQNRRLKRCIFTIGYCFLAIFSATGYRQLAFLTHDPSNVCAQLQETAQEQSVPTILFYEIPEAGKFSHILRAKAPDIRSFQIESGFLVADTLDFYMDAADAIALGESNLLITTKEAFSKLPLYIRNHYQHQGKIAAYEWYRTDDNPCDFARGLPRSGATESVDYVYTRNFHTAHAQICAETGQLQSDGTAGRILWGDLPIPADAQKHTYTLELSYEVLQAAAEAGTVSLLADGTCIASATLEAGQTKARLSRLQIPLATALQLTVTQPDGTHLFISDIRYFVD